MAAVLGVVLTAPPLQAREHPMVTLQVWLTAIDRHEAGRNDAAVRSIVNMPQQDFEAAFGHMVLLLQAVVLQEKLDTGRSRDFGGLFSSFVVRLDLSKSDRDILKGLAEAIGMRGFDRFLKGAAMLHTDAAIFHPNSQLTSREGIGHLTSDGRGEGERGRPWHWMLAREFLHLVLDRTPDDEDARVWYRAVANHFWAVRNFTEALPHMQKAIEQFPRDPELQFVRGLIHETQSAPQIQAAVAEQQALRTGNPGVIYIPSVGSAASERREAEDAFRIAIAEDPNHLEARMRLAHLLTYDRRHDEAVKELAIVLAGVEHPWHRYFASLLMGRAEEGRKRPAEARAAYEAAAALFPEAQAPRVAISQIDLRAGDREAAMKVFELLGAERLYDADPWWQYDAVRTPESERAWLLRMRDAFREVMR
jgi:tetratricopeptide (TPR) repeat protein